MRPRTVTDRTAHRIDGRLQAKLDELAAALVSEVLAAARRSLEAADGSSVRPNRHGVRRLRALQRAIDWQLQIESGSVRSGAEIARREGLTRTSVAQTLRLLDRLNDGAAPLGKPITLPQRDGASYQLTQGGQLQGYRQLRKQVLRHFETDYLMAALQAASGSISAAARIARVDRKHLWRLIQRTGVRYVP
jgi:DNA-binding NtrC family response regulator